MEEIRDVLQIFAEQVHEILGSAFVKTIVYGSYARGDYHEDSDVDIMVLTKLSEAEIKQKEDYIYGIAFDIFMKYGIEISIIIKNVTQYEYWLGTLPFYNNVQKEGIVIDGG
ncbi:MAG: nucleotidyltransferase domain-containing protein [Butyrivibrio sp.]|nr:nucleotidyltransferase domain-containing protein [Butyrivibrio sp.]